MRSSYFFLSSESSSLCHNYWGGSLDVFLLHKEYLEGYMILKEDLL